MRIQKKLFCFYENGLPGVIQIGLSEIQDNRGRMIKAFSSEAFCNNGISFELKETIYLFNKKGVLRGMHFQSEKGQPKLLNCISGKVWTAVADMNPDRKTFGKWMMVDINDYNAAYVPGDYAVGTLAITEAIIACNYAEGYYKEYESGFKWDDPSVGIEWPIHLVKNPILSERDKQLQSFQELKQEILKK